MSESFYAELENCHIVTNGGMFLPPLQVYNRLKSCDERLIRLEIRAGNR
ncbi:MAG: hypothetical protein EDM05_040800 [Leptolyngbya sp. IPPAS B-1204]